MKAVGQLVATGAVWMVGLKLIERGIGFVSTLILARLLLPADFGLVAMAMAVFAFVEIAGSFGFDVALIRNREATRAHYDSAWTLQLGYGVLAALLLAGLAWPAAAYFSEPRLVVIMLVLAAIALLQSLENIGIVDFRKDFQFGQDFQLMLSKKLIAFVVTLALALSLRNYWALLGGIAVSRLSGVWLSYRLHPYRPRPDLSQIRGLLNFSRWIVLSRVIDFFNDRGPDFLLGRFLDAGSLGLYRVARELATLPTTELLFPIMRAVFPGYAAVAKDRSLLAGSFLTVQGVIVLVTVPAGVAIVLLAEPIVRLLLGPNWLEAIPLIRILGIYGALTVFQATNVSIFQVLGVPYYMAMLKAAEVVILVSSMAFVLSSGTTLAAAAWCVVGAQVVVLPAGLFLISRLLGVGWLDRLRVTWRPMLGTAAMSAAIWGVLSAFGSVGGALDAALQLVLAAAAGGLLYIGVVYGLWRLCGAPAGPELRVLSMLRERFQHKPAADPSARTP